MSSKKEILDRINASAEAYFKKQEKKYAVKKPRKSNAKPEKETEKAILIWAAKNDLQIFRTDSSAKYSCVADRHLKNSSLESGQSDFSGDTPLGIAAYIEAKAKGSIKNISFNQYKFLVKKARRGCFAVTVDCSEVLDFFYEQWSRLIMSGKRTEAIKFLLDQIPKKKSKFNDDFDL